MPAGWARANLGEIGRYLNGRAFKKSEWSDRGRMIIRIQDLTQTGDSPNFFVGEVEPRYEVRKGDLLISWAATLGAFIWAGPDAVLNQHIFKVESRIDARFHYYLVTAILNDLYRQTHGSGMVHITKGRFEATPILLPPLAEQRRIVGAIEEHLSDLDAAVAALERVRAALPRYRAAVLKAACEGRIVETEADVARTEGRHYETGRELVGRTIGSQLPAGVESLYDAPSGWYWVRLRDVAALKGGITKGQRRKNGERLREVPYLRVANVQRGRLDLSEMKTILAAEDEIAALALRKGDVLFNEGGDRDKLGRGWVWSGELPLCIHQNHVFRARVREGLIDPRLLSWYGNSFGQGYFNAEGKQTTNLASINMTKLGNLPVPVPPAAEQQRIIAEVDRRLSLADAAARSIENGLVKAKRLRQAILKRAFEGKLIPHDPNDEPASLLLERIRAARATSTPSGRTKRRKPA